MSRVFSWIPFLGRNRTPTRPVFLEFRSSTAYIIFSVAMAVFVDIFLYSVIVPVLPFSLVQRVGIRKKETQYWVSVLLAIYGAALLIFSPICGCATDKFGSRRLPFLAGVLLLTGATFFLALGRKISLFVVGRILQGMSAAVVWIAGLALLVDTVSSRAVGFAMGFVAWAMCSGLLLGPVLGGIILAEGGFLAVFGVCFAFLAADIVLRLGVIEKEVKHQWLAGTGPGTAQATGPTENPSRSLSAIVEELKTLKMPPLVTLLRSRRLLSALWCSFVQASLLTSQDTTLPLRVREVFGWNSLGAGLIFIPIVIPSFLSPLIGQLSDRYGPRYPSTVGFLLSCPCLVGLGLVDQNTIGHKTALCTCLFFLGFSLALILTPMMAEITYAVEDKGKATDKRPAFDLGKHGAIAQAYALFNVAYAGGCIVGPLWGGLVREAAGYRTACWTLGVFGAVTAAPAFLWSGGWWFDATKRKWHRLGEGADVEERQPVAEGCELNTLQPQQQPEGSTS